MSLAQLRIDSREGTAVVQVVGEVDVANAPELGEQLADTVGNTGFDLVLDLSATTYLDSAGVNLLFDLADRLRFRQQQLHVVVPDGARVERLLSIVALDQRIPVYPAVEDALAVAQNSGRPHT